MKKTGKYGLIGERLGHSCSPEIHHALASYDYDLVELAREDLPGFFADCPLDGFNVTIPYKKEVIPYLRDLSPTAARIGSVNTVLRCEEGFFGDNTDYEGFLHLLDRLGVPVKGKKCLVLGSGGVSLTVQTALRDRGAREVVVISRSGENNYGNLGRHFDAQILVNATPVGMFPCSEQSPLSLRRFTALEGVADLIFNPRSTVLVEEARSRGIPALSGMPMLVAQARAAAEIFTGQKISREIALRVEAQFEERF